MNRKGNEFNEMMANLKKLRQWLPAGYVAVLAERTGLSTATVSNSLLGRTRRFDVIRAAIEMAKEQKAVADELKRLVNEEG